MLQDGYHDVRLDDEEMHCIALWIDTNCRFFSPTRHLMSQAMGQQIVPEIK